MLSTKCINWKHKALLPTYSTLLFMYSSAVEATIIQQTWLIYLQTCLQGSFYAFIEIAWLTVSSLPWEIMDAESLRKYKKQLDKFIEQKVHPVH